MIFIQFVGLLWLLVEYISDNKFSCHFSFFLKFVSFLLENEYGRVGRLRHTV